MRAVYALILLAAACGGDSKKPPKPKPEVTKVPPPDTEADREKKRHALAAQIVPEGSKCLPAALKDESATRLELAAVGKDAVVCAIDIDAARLLGPVGCWTVNLSNGELTPKELEPLPNRGIAVALDHRCARSFCIPKEAKLEAKTALMARNFEGTKVAVLAGDDVHIFKADTKEHVSSFTIRGDKGVTGEPTAVHFVDDEVLVEANDQNATATWVFKSDGTKVGPITALGGKQEKAVNTARGSFSILTKKLVGLSERGMETLTTYDVTNGARAKLVRKAPKVACKQAEVDAFWTGGDKVGDKCKDSITKAYAPLIGATVVSGAHSFLVLLRGPRLGELAVMDNKTLAEKSVIKMPWCDAGGAKAADNDAPKTEKVGDEKKAAPPAKPASAPAKKASPKKGTEASDPQEGGQ